MQLLATCPPVLRSPGFLLSTLQAAFETPCRWEFRNQTFSWLAEGILEVTPHTISQSEALILSAGIHGDETAPIEWICELVQALINGNLNCARPLLVILGHPAAMRAHRRYLQENLNRLFKVTSASHENPTVERTLAQSLMSVVSTFHANHGNFIHLDLHTAIRGSLIEQFAIVPQSHSGLRWDEGLRLLNRCGIGAAVRQTKVSATFSGWTHHALKALSFTLELGKVAPFGQNDLGRLEALNFAIKALLSGNEAPNECKETLTSLSIFEVSEELINTGESFALDVNDDIPNFTQFETGMRVWHDQEQSYSVRDGPVYLLFPNPTVPPGQRAGLLIRRVD